MNNKMIKTLMILLFSVVLGFSLTACNPDDPFGGGGTTATSKIYIADTNNHRIVTMDDMSGTGWTTLGIQGSGSNQFNTPYGVFVR